MGSALPPPGLAANADPPWIPPGDALARVQEAIGDRHVAIETIVRRLKAGLLKASFETYQMENSTRQIRIDGQLIDQRFWAFYDDSDSARYLWYSGDLRLDLGNFFDTPNERLVLLTFFRVRIERDGIEEIVENATPLVKRKAASSNRPERLPVEPQIPVNKGGRPRKNYWDDLWAEICGQIYEGKLIPERQADIEKAMLDWATNHGHELSEAGARQRARILFNRLKTRG